MRIFKKGTCEGMKDSRGRFYKGYRTKQTEATKQKMSESCKGRSSAFKGKTHTLEARLKLSEHAKKKTMNKNSNWKGGVRTSRGYILIKTRHDKRNHGYVPEHILIAERVLGRNLKKGECVHHINGIKDDNRNKNLLICERGYHHQLHYRMSRLYQREHFT